MIYVQCLDTIQACRSGAILDGLSRALWSQNTGLSDDELQGLAEAIHTRRQELKPGHHRQTGQGSRITLPRPKAQKARDRNASKLRSRQLAASGPMPPAMAAQFTTAELAALKIVADEIRAKGVCSLVLDAIAARAGVSKRSVQNAMREAETLGYLKIRRRRLPGQLKNLPNQVQVVSTEWLAWLKVAKSSRPRVESILISSRSQYDPHSQGLVDQAARLRRRSDHLRRDQSQSQIRSLR